MTSPEEGPPSGSQTIEEIPWESPPEDIYYIIARRAFAEEQMMEQIVPMVEKVMIQMAEGPTVREILPEELARLDAYTTSYRQIKGRDTLKDILHEYAQWANQPIPPVQLVEGQIVVIFNPALRKTERDPLLVLSDPDGRYSGKIRRREAIVVGIATGELAIVRVSPTVAAATGLEIQLPHQIFKRLAKPSEENMVIRVRRRKHRLSEPVE